jgi:hypothetical protein
VERGWRRRFADQLHYAANGGLTLTASGAEGGETISLAREANGLSDQIKAKFPYLSGYGAYKVSASDLVKVPEILKKPGCRLRRRCAKSSARRHIFADARRA